MSERLTPERLAEIRQHELHPGYPHCECVRQLLDHIDAQQAELDRLRSRTHELQERHDQELSEANAFRRHWKDLLGRANEAMKDRNPEPVLLYSANERAQWAVALAEIERLASQVAALRTALFAAEKELWAWRTDTDAFASGCDPMTYQRPEFEPAAVPVLADTEAAAREHDQRLRLEGARELVARATRLRDGTTPNWEIAARNWIRNKLDDMEAEGV